MVQLILGNLIVNMKNNFLSLKNLHNIFFSMIIIKLKEKYIYYIGCGVVQIVNKYLYYYCNFG